MNQVLWIKSEFFYMRNTGQSNCKSNVQYTDVMSPDKGLKLLIEPKILLSNSL